MLWTRRVRLISDMIGSGLGQAVATAGHHSDHRKVFHHCSQRERWLEKALCVYMHANTCAHMYTYAHTV